jgi:glutamyl/glutaminyl-tRNA synthetase
MPDKIVTRFAPSPTGYLHVGGARTALFNWLWARKNGGTFLLRIEDTDQKRNTPTATAQVMQDLRWLGITWDQGPEVGGPHGPYLQSQRTEIYDRYIKQLVDQGKAYYCLESVEELAALREEAEEQVGGLVYRRSERVPTAEEVEQAKSEGRPVAVRFAVPQDRPIVVHDLIRGTITFRPQEIGDFVILKSDGFPTYNFACVVDDFLMKVTHVIRGQEHLNNTPCQQLLWETLFGSDSLPKYAHMSVTVSEGGGKLSKRERPQTLRQHLLKMAGLMGTIAEIAAAGGITVEQLQSFLDGHTTPDMPSIDAMARHLGVRLPEINVVDFSRSGYLPETLVNFLALLGWNPGDNREVMVVEELIASFDVARLTKSNSLFDRAKLLAFNTEHLRTVPRDRLIRYFREYLRQTDSPILAARDDQLGRLIALCGGARTLAEIEAKCRFAFISKDQIQYDEKAVQKVMIKDGGLAVLPVIAQRLAALQPFTEEGLEAMLRGLAEERGVGLGKVAQPLRVALTGTTVSPSIFESVQLLGVVETLARIQLAVTHLGRSA